MTQLVHVFVTELAGLSQRILVKASFFISLVYSPTLLVNTLSDGLYYTGCKILAYVNENYISRIRKVT